jgi:hypothetical protein
MVGFTRSVLLFSLLIVFTIFVNAQDPRPYNPLNHFIIPPLAALPHAADLTIWASNPIYTINTPINFTWITNQTGPLQMNLFHDGTTESQLLTSKCSEPVHLESY